MSDIRVGPSFEHCDECGGENDGYSDVLHRAGCSKEPYAKARRAHATIVPTPDFLQPPATPPVASTGEREAARETEGGLPWTMTCPNCRKPFFACEDDLPPAPSSRAVPGRAIVGSLLGVRAVTALCDTGATFTYSGEPRDFHIVDAASMAVEPESDLLSYIGRAHCSTCQKRIDDAVPHCSNPSHQTFATLRSRLAALEADAALLDWMEAERAGVAYPAHGCVEIWWGGADGRPRYRIAETLRAAALDASRTPETR